LLAQPAPESTADASIWHCPRCGTVMVVIQVFTVEQCPHGAVTLTLHRADRQTGPPTCLRRAIDLVRSLLMPYPPNLLRRALRRPPRSPDDSDRSALAVSESLPATHKGFPQTTETPFNLHTHWPRPPQTPASSF
jgi:hypothetical protein